MRNPTCEQYAGKKVTVLGLGLLGRAAGDAEFFAKCGAEVTVTDIKDKEELAKSVAPLMHYPNVTFHLGGHRTEDFTHCDMVIKAAGVRMDSPEVAAAKAAHVPVFMSTALFAKYACEAGVTIVGITGTRGKSTITHLVHHVLTRTGRRVVLGGNIRGVSTLAMLPEVKKGDIAVLELDSWQLQGFGDLKISPQVAIFSNLMEDHLNYYPSMEAYFDDKANIFRHQKEGDALFVGTQILSQVEAARPPIKAQVPPSLSSDWKLKIPGAHNRENASLAAGALRALGLSEEEIRSGLESFEGVEGRLQFVRERNGVKIYNDNNATTPQATIAALQALDEGKKNILLIMGGSDKKIDMTGLLGEVARTCRKVYLLAGTGTDHIKAAVPDALIYDSLEGAVAAALNDAKNGEVVLFSPAFASFGLFKNEYERNDRFMAAVQV